VSDEFDLVAMAEIARRLDGLPLALELAAPRLRSMTAAELLKRLERPLQDLIGGPRTVERRQQTLRATVEWSYALLNERQRAAFERMSVFVDGASFQAADAICADEELPTGEIATVLGDLVDRSVLIASQRDEDGQTRYRLLDTLRDFGRERLADAGALEELRRRHAHHFGSFAAEQRRAFAGPGEVDAYFSVDREFENIRAAHSWALESGDLELALGLPSTLRWWAQMQLRPEVFEWAERAIDAFGDDERATIDDRLARALGTAATGVWMRGDYSASAKLCEQGLAIASSDLTRAELLTPSGMVDLLQGRVDECIAIFEKATALAAEAGDAYHAAVWMTPLALALSYRGDNERAVATISEQGRRLAALGQPATGTAMALHLYATGEVLLETAPDRALEALDRSLAICRSGICPFVMGVALVSATSLRARHGDPNGAIDAFSEAVKHWWQAGEWAQQWITLRNLIELLDRLDQHQAAATLLGACEAAVQAPPLFGPAAARLAVTVRSLTEALGQDGFNQAHAHGSGLTGANILQFALEALQAAKRQ
jgi:tetratricopeptide (TPR) repeat protein